jgi:hypothetical protein
MRKRPLIWLMIVFRREGAGLVLDHRGRIFPVPIPMNGKIAERLAAIP